METIEEEIKSSAIKFSIVKEGKKVARAFIFIIKNGLHNQPYALLEDVYVEEEHRGQGLGSKITKTAILKAKDMGCYKIVCTSRFGREKVHELYEKLGFKKHGNSFRIDF